MMREGQVNRSAPVQGSPPEQRGSGWTSPLPHLETCFKMQGYPADTGITVVYEPFGLAPIVE